VALAQKELASPGPGRAEPRALEATNRPGVAAEAPGAGDTRNVTEAGGAAADTLDRILDRGTIALSAEMLGGARESFDRTVQYLKDRKQFGVAIGSFQALKHRAAHLFCELELLTSIVLHALRSDDATDRAKVACVAKARATDAFLQATSEGVQMHGGIGVTDDHDIGLFLKRARVCEMMFGNSAYQRDRFAALSGY
jgi:acyl-CoA dehydrogenase